MEKVTIYTDGSSSPKHKTGGWAFCITNCAKEGLPIYQDGGAARQTSNNRMELIAVINAITYALGRYENIREINIVTDSQYVRDPFVNDEFMEWEELNWRTVSYIGDIGERKNRDLWERAIKLVRVLRRRNIALNVMWVKGHSGDRFNEIVDGMARRARESGKINKSYEHTQPNQ